MLCVCLCAFEFFFSLVSPSFTHPWFHGAPHLTPAPPYPVHLTPHPVTLASGKRIASVECDTHLDIRVRHDVDEEDKQRLEYMQVRCCRCSAYVWAYA